MTTLTFTRWVGGPGGHAVPMGAATFTPDGGCADVSPAMFPYFLLGDVWTLARALHVFRVDTHSAYGWPMHGQSTALGEQAMAWAEPEPHPRPSIMRGWYVDD